MIIVAGYITVAPRHRDEYLDTCIAFVESARRSTGCLDFATSPDIVDPARINVYERWATRNDLESFRGDGPAGDLMSMIVDIAVSEFDATQSSR